MSKITEYLVDYRENLKGSGVMVKSLDCGIVVSEFELQT